METGFYTQAQVNSQSYDFYPATSPAAPLLIYIHGGAWRFGDKSAVGFSDTGTHRLQEAFATAGFAVASINYRLSHQALFPAQINDVKAAIRYFRAGADRFGIDPARIVVTGSSAGGHLAMLAAATAGLDQPYLEGTENKAVSSEVAAAVSIYGVSDLRTIFEDRPLCGQPLAHKDDDGAEWRLLGSTYPAPAGSVAEVNWAQAHPIDYYRTGTDISPTYLVHGTADGCVPYIQSQRVFDTLTDRGVDSRLVLVEGADHADPLCYRDEVLAPMVDWVISRIS